MYLVGSLIIGVLVVSIIYITLWGRHLTNNQDDVIKNIADFIWVADKDNKIVYSMSKTNDDIHEKQLVGTTLDILYAVYPEVIKDITQINHKGTPFSKQRNIGTKHYEIRYFSLDKGRRCAVGLDISAALNSMENDLPIEIYLDPLTKLPNRELFKDRANGLIHSANRNQQMAAFMSLDLDYFKDVNDTYGHPVGDRLLQQVGQRIQECLRKNDIVGRLGGDEFAVVLSGVKSADDCTLVAEKIISRISAPYTIDDNKITIGTSLGISIYPNDAKDFNAMMKNSDLALYHSKHTGKNKYSFFESKLQEEVTKKIEMGKEIQKGIHKGQFYLEYHPVVNLANGEAMRFEALLRWKHKRLGSVSPEKFIPIAEEKGLIIPLTYYVIHQACKDIAKLKEEGKNINVSINIPGVILAEDFADRIESILNEYQINPYQIKLEITEHSAMKDLDRTKTMMEILSDKGFHFSIDDFGTGYSSLSNLTSFNFNELKIDKSFIEELEKGSGSSKIVKAILSLCKVLNLHVVAEGVEKEDQIAWLMQNGCNTVQGYIFDEPLGVSKLSTYLDKAPVKNSEIVRRSTTKLQTINRPSRLGKRFKT